MKVQVWLELVKIHLNGPSKGEKLSSGVRGARQGGRTKRIDEVKPAPPPRAWDDEQFMNDLGKPDGELEEAAKQMNFEALCRQNQCMEGYMMRLVRQRDNLKHLTTLADECASYLVLGLEGPTASADEVKKAYRSLALKEHPDKAGTENKERFQEIQKAYASVVKQQKRSTSSSEGDHRITGGSCLGPVIADFTKEAASHAESAKLAADCVTSESHAAFQLCERAVEATSQRKRAALRELTDVVKNNMVHMRRACVSMHDIRDRSCNLSHCTDKALSEYGSWAASIMSGVGLRERAEYVKASGLSCMMTGDHLDEMAVNDERLLAMIANPESSIDQASAIRVLAESVGRTAAVLRCAADKALNTTTSVLELSCSLAMLDREKQGEKEAKRSDSADSPMPAPASEDGFHSVRPSSGSKASRAKKKSPREDDEESSESSDEESDVDLNLTEEEGKPKQAKLRVRNLRWLESLNKEVLDLQKKLRQSIQEESGMLKGVAPTQKGSVFELVGQLLHSALAEANRLVKDTSMPTRQVLDQTLAFALALEHTKQVAVPGEVRTQVLKHAALLDLDLLCQIIEGPFQKRLLGIGANLNRRTSTGAPNSRPKSFAPGGTFTTESWQDLVPIYCSRISASLREPF